MPLKTTACAAWRAARAWPCARRFATGAQPTQAPASAVSAAPSRDGSDVEVRFADGALRSFHPLWLYYNAPGQYDGVTNQKTAGPADLLAGPQLQALRVDKEGALLADFRAPEDGHGAAAREGRVQQLRFPGWWLARHGYSAADLSGMSIASSPGTLGPGARPAPPASASPAAPGTHAPLGAHDVPRFPFADIMRSEAAVLSWLRAVNEYGLALVEGCPTAEDSVLRVAERIADPMPTIYGTSFEVSVAATPINIAYAPVGLDLHIDLAYYESPPGLQLLHCRAFDADIVGGESTFVDGFAAARLLRERDPDAFAVLSRVPATFQKVHYARERPVHMVYQRPHLALGGPGGATSAADPESDVTSVFWAPPFEGPLRVPAADVEPYYRAYAAFSRVLRDVESGALPGLVEFRMQPGELSVFNNRRMLHGRRRFWRDATAAAAAGAGAACEGRRVLQGCYLNIDEYRSRLAVLATRGPGTAGAGSDPHAAAVGATWNAVEAGVRRVGNQCWL